MTCSAKSCTKCGHGEPEVEFYASYPRERNCKSCVRARQEQYNQRNAAKINERSKEYYVDNRPQCIAQSKRSRARKYGAAVNDLTAAQWATLKDLYDFCCFYCKRKFSGEKLTQDHMTPLSRGGGHTITNVAPACFSCNSSKKEMTSQEYFQYLGRRTA